MTEYLFCFWAIVSGMEIIKLLKKAVLLLKNKRKAGSENVRGLWDCRDDGLVNVQHPPGV